MTNVGLLSTQRVLLVCRWFVVGMLLVCCWYVVGMLFFYSKQ